MPPYQATDRGQIAYHAERYASLTDNTELALADRVASFMLAIVWSCGVAGVEGPPHQPSYSTYTSTRPNDMTLPSHAATATQGMTRRERGQYNNRRNITTQITNTETPETAAHWLRERHMRQLDIQLDCVAAAYVDGTWYFAANNLVIIDSDVASTLDELGTPGANYRVVYDPTPNMHAEMKILKYLRARGIALAGVNMGVSKPCCPDCANVLNAQHVNYTSYHNTAVLEGRWVAPF
jgi:hypothetical protein